MIKAKTLYNQLLQQLKLNESADEIEAIAFAVLDHFNISRTDVIANKEIDENKIDINPIIYRLNQCEPLQYILNEAWFCGRKYYVDSAVLIPRPETELLVEEAVKAMSGGNRFSVLDIGTGSGCIAISISLVYPEASVTAVDISEQALEVATRNAQSLQAHVLFKQADVLNDFHPEIKYDLIVSNPPYISGQEIVDVARSVKYFEPHEALFISESDPLIFYKAIGRLADKYLSNSGFLITEINERYSIEVSDIYNSCLLTDICVLRDLSNKPRLVVARKK